MASSPAQKKKEETSLKLLRELISLPNNKQCFECQQKGPTYVDMTTCAFICTQCSGFLRGINPPHRVKSVSMTTFNNDEIQKLKSGGNELAQMIWMSSWDSRRDREPSKKDEQAFKEFLRDKYERKKWYRDPNEVKKDIASKSNAETTQNASKPVNITIPPPQSSGSPQVVLAKQQAPPTQQPITKPKETSLIDVFETEPFVPAAVSTTSAANAMPKAPVGGVSVFPSQPPPPSNPSNQSNSSGPVDFGAFTSSSDITFNGGSGILLPSNSSSASANVGGGSAAQLLIGQNESSSSGSAVSTGGNDRYAALANLDKTLNAIRLVEEKEKEQKIMQEQQQQQQIQQQQLQQQQIQQQQQQMLQQQQMMQQQMMQQHQMMQGGMGGGGGMVNPFNQLTKRESNPFLMGGPTPPITGPTRPYGGVYPAMSSGQISPAMMGGMGGGYNSPSMMHGGQVPMQQQQPQGVYGGGFGGGVATSQQTMMMGQGGAPGMMGGWQGGGMAAAPQQFGYHQQPLGGVSSTSGYGGFVAASPSQPVGTPPAPNRQQFNWSNVQVTGGPPPQGGAASFGSQPQQTTPTGWGSNWNAFGQQNTTGTVQPNPFAGAGQPTGGGNPFM